MCHLQETHFRSNGTHRLKVKRWKHFSCKCYPKESRGHSTNIKKKIDFKLKKEDKGHFFN